MEIILTEMTGQTGTTAPAAASGRRLFFPMLPEEISVKTSALFASYRILKLGTVKLPSARDLTGFSWEGILPGEARKNSPYITNWTDPKQLQILWSIYQRDGVKLRLMITETPINHDVYIDSYDMKYKHGFGDYYYSISFVHAIDISVNLSSEKTVEEFKSSRPSPPPADTVTVKKNDTVWSIAQQTTGDGSNYEKLITVNDMKNIDYSDFALHPGQVIRTPNPLPNAAPKAGAQKSTSSTHINSGQR